MWVFTVFGLFHTISAISFVPCADIPQVGLFTQSVANYSNVKDANNSAHIILKATLYCRKETSGAFHSTIAVWNFSRSQWNGTFRLHRPDPSHRAFGYCSCKQDSKERYWGQQFCQIEREISVQPTVMTRPVKVDHLQRWCQTFRSDRTEMVCSIWFLTEISGILGWVESARRVRWHNDDGNDRKTMSF